MPSTDKKYYKLGKSLVGSVKKDLNALQPTFREKAKGAAAKFFGVSQNNIDQRINNGLSDLLSGALGVRSSNIPAIQNILEGKEAARKLAQEAVKPARRAENPPSTSKVLQFPHNYFNEMGVIRVEEMEGYEGGFEGQPRELYGAQSRFPNSIHFRSLKRKNQDASEKPSTWGTEWGKNIRNQDIGSHGSVDNSKEPLVDIFLYLPPQLSDSVKVSYTEGEAGMMEKFFANLFSTGEDDENVKDMGGGNNFDMNEMMKMFKGMLPGSKLIQQAAGAMTNPMKFQTLENVGFRTYSYKFTLKPTTKEEASEIKEIIHAFRLSMLPGVAGENDMIWTFPNEWAISFQGPVKKWLDHPMASVCTGCDIDYAGGGSVVMMEDGSPASIDMTVEFLETTQLNRQKYGQQVSAFSNNEKTNDRTAEKGTILNTNPITNPGASNRAT